MPELVTCPSCTKQLRVPDALLGKNVKCPQCGTIFVGGAADAGPAYDDPRPDWQQYADRPVRPRYPRGGYDDDYDRPWRGRRDYELPHRSGAVLTLGILGLVFSFLSCLCVVGLILSVIAIGMGGSDLAKMRQGIMDPSGEGSTQAGRVCGIIGLIISSLVTLLFLVVFLMALGQPGAFR
jgi:predicted Zn finger-like uncharacterized protein